MKSNNNTQFLSSITSAASIQIEQVVEYILVLDSLTLQRPRSDGGWSIAQCLAHLNTYSAHYLPLIENAVKSYRAKGELKSFKSGWLGNYFIQMIDPDTNNATYKAAKRHIPKKPDNPFEDIEQFINNGRKLIVLLALCEQVDLNAIRIETSISRFIRLKLGDVLRFLVLHNERHLRQAMKMVALTP